MDAEVFRARVQETKAARAKKIAEEKVAMEKAAINAFNEAVQDAYDHRHYTVTVEVLESTSKAVVDHAEGLHFIYKKDVSAGSDDLFRPKVRLTFE